jgi:nicotinamidase-related amidase
MQSDIVGLGSSVFMADALLTVVNGMIKKARKKDTPIIFLFHTDSDTPGDAVICQELDYRQSDILVEKHTPDSFHDTDLQAWLGCMKIEELVVVGVRTEYCIDSTCRRAFSLGYTVDLITDGHSTQDNGNLTARQIIDHHNEILGDWFVRRVSWRDAEM